MDPDPHREKQLDPDPQKMNVIHRTTALNKGLFSK